MAATITHLHAFQPVKPFRTLGCPSICGSAAAISTCTPTFGQNELLTCNFLLGFQQKLMDNESTTRTGISGADKRFGPDVQQVFQLTNGVIDRFDLSQSPVGTIAAVSTIRATVRFGALVRCNTPLGTTIPCLGASSIDCIILDVDIGKGESKVP